MTTFTLQGKQYHISDLSVLKNFNAKQHLILEPYPHIVIKDAVNPKLYKLLEHFYPDDQTIFELDNQKHPTMYHNTRYQMNAIDTVKSHKIVNLWKMFVDYHTSRDFLEEVVNAFGKERFNAFDNIQNKLSQKNITNGDYKNLSVGKRPNKNRGAAFDIVLDCQIGINSPCTELSIVKGPHIDNLNEIYAGLFYMKQKTDTGHGGNLEIYNTQKLYNNLTEFKDIIRYAPKKKGIINGRPYSGKQEFNPEELTLLKEVEYDKNTFAMFLCDINSIHGVSPREVNPVSRRLVNIIGESYCKANDQRF